MTGHIIIVVGVISCLINAFLNRDIEPAFMGWLCASFWAVALLISELANRTLRSK